MRLTTANQKHIPTLQLTTITILVTLVTPEIPVMEDTPIHQAHTAILQLPIVDTHTLVTITHMVDMVVIRMVLPIMVEIHTKILTIHLTTATLPHTIHHMEEAVLTQELKS